MKSMTAYATVHSRRDAQSVQVVVRSLNFKYLDIAVRNLPVESILLEEEIKHQIKRSIFRGRVEVFVFLTEPKAKNVYIDEKVVSKYVFQIRKLAKKHHIGTEINLSDIVNLPQAVYWEQRTASGQSLVIPAVQTAIARLVEFKKKQGRIIQKEMLSNLSKLKANLVKIKANKPDVASSGSNGKEDIDEEISLSGFYLAKLEKKIDSPKEEPKGKAIDFLTQEILRELNAASSKTKKKVPALLIVEAKNYLERIREQAQNVE